MFENKKHVHVLRTYHRRSIFGGFVGIVLIFSALMCRMAFLMVVQSDHFGEAAKEVQERERSIKAERGRLFDRNGKVIASNKSVCTVSVIHNQIKEPNKVVYVLSHVLKKPEEEIKKRVEKKSSIERIATNVDKKVADLLRSYALEGVMVDEDYKRYYPYDSLASKVIGFTGSDNQGIIGLEVKYDSVLQGKPGKILTLTNARGEEIANVSEQRIEPVAGNDLYLSLDVTIQKYAQQIAEKVRIQKEAKEIKVIILNPQNGEIYAMVNEPEFSLNDPFALPKSYTNKTEKEKNQYRNNLWRNGCVSDTYEPGSIFKIITATAALSEGKVKVEDTFFCPGYKIVEDRRIRCHKIAGHGQETFREGIMNSCNPVFMEIAQRTGVDAMYRWYKKLGLFEKTGIDLPGEANSIFHKKDKVGEVELATMAFGQSIQVTPMQLLRAACAIVNGGRLITPHVGVKIVKAKQGIEQNLSYQEKKDVVSQEVSVTMRELLEAVVAEGGGKNAYIEGYRMGGKTATSEKLPRSSKKYISSFMGFAPAQEPQVMAIILIDEPKGLYYGGTIAAPAIREIYENILPYLEIPQVYASFE